MPNYSTCSSIYMLTSLLRIFTKEKEKQCHFIVNNFMNQPTNRNILWDVTRSRVSARKFINLTESWPTRLFAITVTYRGGVEDTRLKAKDTKKIRGQGQGQPFRGQTLSRPRTGMLEAKDQGHKAQVLSKKKKKRSSQKFFKRSPRKNVFQKIFQPLHKILTSKK